MIVLASCQDVAEEPATIAPVELEPGYPSLHTVPPRPQLSYTVEQRRAIVQGLVADRENARYSDNVVRYRAGLSSLPPPAVPALGVVALEPESEDRDAADAIAPPVAASDASDAAPETEFLYEDDDLDSFMEEMDDDRLESTFPAGGGPGGEPEANAAPRGTTVVRASAVRPIPPTAAYPGRAPVVTLAMPPKAASLPVPDPAGPTGSDRTRRAGTPGLAGRAPGVIWGMPDLGPPLAEPAPAAAPPPDPRAAPPPPAPVETRLAGHAPGIVWGMPDLASARSEPMPAASEPRSERARPPASLAPAPAELVLAGRAPGVVWGMPDPAPARAEPIAAAMASEAAHGITATGAAPSPAPAKPGTAPVETVLAGAPADPVSRARASMPAAPPAPAPVKPAAPATVDGVLAGPASEPVRAVLIAIADGPAEPPAETGARTRHATAPAGVVPQPAPAKPALTSHAAAGAPGTTALDGLPMPAPRPKPVADAPGIEVAGGLVAIPAAPSHDRAAALGSVPFGPQSAMLTPDAVARLGRFLAETKAHEARIKIVGEGTAPSLALDRALAVGLALVQSGVPADRLQLRLARGGSVDQARLFLATPAL